MLFNRLIFLPFVPVALGSMRYVVDRRSCNTDELYNKVKAWMESAKSRSELVVNVLTPVLEDPNQNPLNDRIKDKANLLFGSTDLTTIQTIFDKFRNIRSYVFVDIDNLSDEWKKERDSGDLEIFCNANYVTDDSGNTEPNINWKDTVQDLPVEDGRSLIKLKDPTSSLAAVASPASPRQLGQQWPEGSPEVITFHPSYIETVLRDKVVFDKDRVKKAKTNIVDRIIQKFQRVKDDLTSMDILDTPEATMLHEITHLMLHGHADDDDYPNSYGWANCMRLKSITNAESIMFFGMAVELIQTYKVDVDQKGRLKSFK